MTDSSEDLMTDEPNIKAVGDPHMSSIKEENARILSDYALWKRNAPFLYDMLLVHALEWPSLSVQWLPAASTPHPDQFAHQGLLLATHAPSSVQNSLIVADVKLPLRQRGSDDPSEDINPFLNVVRRVPLPAPACRLRPMPQNLRVVSVAMLNGAGVGIVRLPHTEMGGIPDPEREAHFTRLPGYESKQATFGLSWSPQKLGMLLVGGVDGSLCLWDLSTNQLVSSNADEPDTVMNRSSSAEEKPKSSVSGEPIMDVFFHPKLADLAGVVRGGKALLWDTRTSSSTSVLSETGSRMNSLSFCPTQDQYLVTGGSDGCVSIWDTRNSREPYKRLSWHHGEVLQVEWSPCMEGIISSTAQDRRIFVWDTTRIGSPQTPEERAEGPPELLFIHGGHTSLVTDMAWNPHDPLTMASVARDNILQIWQRASTP